MTDAREETDQLGDAALSEWIAHYADTGEDPPEPDYIWTDADASVVLIGVGAELHLLIETDGEWDHRVIDHYHAED